ncbi:MAG: BtrH N-terminal domain-containing protein [Terracidiphilus sp.]
MKAPKVRPALEPFPCCPALDGCHCVTNSLAKIFHNAGHPLSEEMLLGLGAGMGFIYWQMKMGAGTILFVGGRANPKNFYQDLSDRTGVEIREICTASAKKAEAELLCELARKKPVMLGGDMGFLPWFDFPEDYHFGGHAFVVCGYDGEQTVLASDMDPQMSGVKRGFYAPVKLEQLAKARSSAFKPFPPKNLRLEFDFAGFRAPGRREILGSITQTVDALLRPPIKNFGIAGLRHTAKQILRWPSFFNEKELRENLFNLYVFIEIGGTGGGCFRPMYARFLEESAGILALPALAETAEIFHQSGGKFTEIALLFKDAQKMTGIEENVRRASRLFEEIADLEEKGCRLLEKIASAG